MKDETRLLNKMESDQALSDLVGHLKSSTKLGSKIPNQRDLAELLVGYSRQTIREGLIRLECFGYISISHGKSSVLLKELP